MCRIRKGKELIIDVDFKWATDADIGVLVKTKPVGQIKSSLHDFQVFAKARIILTYFVKELPVVGAVIASLLETPQIDFDLRVQGSNITDAIGLENIIQLVIGKIVDDMLLWPARVVTPLIPGIDPENLQPKVLGMLYVQVVSVRDLLSTDLVGRSDPYVQLGVNRFVTRGLSAKRLRNACALELVRGRHKGCACSHSELHAEPRCPRPRRSTIAPTLTTMRWAPFASPCDREWTWTKSGG